MNLPDQRQRDRRVVQELAAPAPRAGLAPVFGTILLEVFFTGMEPQQIALNLAGTTSLERDITLNSSGRTRNDNEIVKLQSLVVSTSREMDGAAIAINEQRFAANIVNVVTLN